MIELTNIKTTDTVRQLRGQINTMQNEIMADQPFVGYVMNPSIGFFAGNTLVNSITASGLVGQRLLALCFPESNGVFVASLFGGIRLVYKADFSFNRIVIDIPGIKLATRDAVIGTFVSPNHLGMSTANELFIGDAYCGNARLLATLMQDDTTGRLTLKAAEETGLIQAISDTAVTIVL